MGRLKTAIKHTYSFPIPDTPKAFKGFEKKKELLLNFLRQDFVTTCCRICPEHQLTI
jgi:hypothetical protein